MSHILVVDPGLSSGIFLGRYSDTEPLTRVAVWQFGGVNDEVRGVEALLQWIENAFDGQDFWRVPGGCGIDELAIVAEKFTPLQGKGFSLTLDAVEPLRCEGALIAKGLMPAEFPHERWQRPDRMVLAGGDTPVQRKKRSDDLLRANNLWCTGRDVGQPDASDAISATKHAVAYMKKIRHAPTLAAMFKEEEV